MTSSESSGQTEETTEGPSYDEDEVVEVEEEEDDEDYDEDEEDEGSTNEY